MTTRYQVGSMRPENLAFAVITFVVVLLTHAIAYLSHEYVHTVTAWCLGWMPKPFDVDYGPITVSNVIFLGDVSDNVNYVPIFATGHGDQAAVIALAGAFLGNGLLYFVIYLLSRSFWVRSKRYLLMFLYWLAVMCAGNVWSYVPMRSITTHADMAIAARGLGISTWTLLPFVLVPSLFVLWHFMTRMFATTCDRITSGSMVNLAVLIAFTGFWYFSFFGGDGIDGSYGFVSQILSIVSRYFLFPLCVAYLASRYLSSSKPDNS
jgi:hypothetical protein